MNEIKKVSKEYNDVIEKLAKALSINDILYMLDLKLDDNRTLESVITDLDGQKRHIIVTPYKYETEEDEP